MSRKYNKQELCNAVYSAVCRAGGGITRLEICEAIGRKKSPHIIAMIESLTVDGWLVRDVRINDKKAPEFVYSIGRVVDGAGACDGQ